MAKVSAEELTKKLFLEILEQIGISAEISVGSEDNTITVNVSGDNLGALIGYHGETLANLQLLLSLMVNNSLKEEDWRRVILDIGNWRKERSDSLKEMLERSFSQLDDSNRSEVRLPTMSAAERREVHVIVSEEYPNYESTSEGEEPERRVVLKKKTS